MDHEILIIFFLLWNFVGWVISAVCIYGEGFEYVNPIWIYNHYHVNYFGAAMIFIFYNLLCPIGSICYWFYKLCTVGRK